MAKTIKVTVALDRANYFLENSPDEAAREREAVANFLETLLHSANAYAGFNYLPSAGVVRDLEEGYATSIADESRRKYYKK
jgi:hypothetical protein